MTDEEFAKKLLVLHSTALKVSTIGWHEVTQTTRDNWIKVASLKPQTCKSPEDFYDLMHKVWKNLGSGSYSSASSGVQTYYRDLWSAIISQNWDDTGTTMMGASTGELKRNEYKLKASGRKFTILGYMIKKLNDVDVDLIVIKFLDDATVVELDKREFEAVAVKLP